MYLADALHRRGSEGTAASLDSPLPPIVSLGIPRSFIAQGKPDRILAKLGLDGPGIASSTRDALEALAGTGFKGVGSGAATGSSAALPATAISNDALD